MGGQTKSYRFRKDALRALLEQVKLREASLLAALEADLGRPEHELRTAEYEYVLHELMQAMRRLRWWMRHKNLGVGKRARLTAEPRGCVLIVGTWSEPLRLTLVPLINAIAAGNCVVLKPSELTPHYNELLELICQTIFPPQYVAVLQGTAELGEELCREAFDFIFFSGNARTGQRVLQQAAKRLTPVSLQLGGKNPCIVSANSDLKRVAEELVHAKLLNNGQSCLAPDYVLVQEAAKDALIEALGRQIRLQVGADPLNDAHYQSVVNETHFYRLLGLMEHARLAWGGRSDATRRKIEPTLLDGVDWTSPCMQQEIMGPILPILTYQQLAPLLQRLNQLPHPLVATYFGQNEHEQRLVIEHLVCGFSQINAFLSPEEYMKLAMGGVGASGHGHYQGRYGFDLFSRLKSSYRGRLGRPRKTFAFYDEDRH